MAGKSASILVKILGDDSKLKRTIDSTSSKLDQFSRKTQSIGTSMAKGGAVATAAVTAPLVALAKGAWDAFGEAQQSQAQLEASLKSTGATAWTSADQIDRLAGSMQDKLAIDGDLIKSGASVLLTFTKVQNKAGEGNDIFDRATQTAADMAAKLGTDLPAANMLLGKALNDPLRGMGALRKAGVQLTADQEKQVEAFVKSGDVLSAQKILLGELETQFGGSAEAAASTAQGGMEKLRLKLEDIQESIGERLVPIVGKLSGWLEKGMALWDKLGERGQTIVLIMAAVAAAIGPVVGVVGALVTAIGFIISPVGLVVAAVVGLVAAFVYFYKTSDSFRKRVDDIVAAVRVKLAQAFRWVVDVLIPMLSDGFRWIVDNVVPVLVRGLQILGDVVARIFRWVVDSLIPAFVQGWQVVADVVPRVFAVVRDVVGTVVSWLQQNVWPVLVALGEFLIAAFQRASAVVSAVLPVIARILGAIAGAVSGFISFLMPLWQGAWSVISTVASTVWNVIRTVVETVLGVIRGVKGVVVGQLLVSIIGYGELFELYSRGFEMTYFWALTLILFATAMVLSGLVEFFEKKIQFYAGAR